MLDALDVDPGLFRHLPQRHAYSKHAHPLRPPTSAGMQMANPQIQQGLVFLGAQLHSLHRCKPSCHQQYGFDIIFLRAYLAQRKAALTTVYLNR